MSNPAQSHEDLESREALELNKETLGDLDVESLADGEHVRGGAAITTSSTGLTQTDRLSKVSFPTDKSKQ